MIINALLALVAYSAILVAIVIFCNGLSDNCNQDCNQGRNCNCDD